MSDLQIKGYENFNSPYYMAGFTALLTLVFMLLGSILGLEGVTKDTDTGGFPWMSAAALILIYMIFSSMFSLVSDDIYAYYRKAFVGFIGLMAANSGLAYLFSGGVWINEVPIFKTIFFILIFAYLVLYVMTILIKKVINMAQREDEEFNKRNVRNN